MDNQPQPPYETPYIPYTPPQPPKNEHKGLKRAGILLLVLLLMGAVGVGAYVFVRNQALKDELQAEKNNSQALQDENKQLKNGPGAAAAMITETLPNGKKMTYPNTEANRNILWWSASPNANEGRDMIVLSHKGFQQFLAMLDSDVITDICGTNAEPVATKYNIVIGNFDTVNGELGDSEVVNCISLLALEDNPDVEMRSAAQGVIDKAVADAKQFTESVTIE